MSLFSPWESTKQGQFCNKTAVVKQATVTAQLNVKN